MTETDRDELRLALVLNGGVSLAIWISGVVAEIDALRRSDDDAALVNPEGDGASSLPIYHELLKALQVRVRVDVIAGTSAGGLNGGLLGTSIAAGKPYTDVRKLWLRLGDLERLFNYGEKGKPKPVSLLKGDAELYGELKKRFRRVLETAEEAEADDPEESGRRVRLVLTGTDVAGVCRETGDSFGGVLTITEHRLQSRFAHGGDADGTMPIGWAEVLPPGADDHTPTADAVARAARTSASFPIAFEPSKLVLSSTGQGAPSTALGDALVTRDGRNVAEVMRIERRHAPLHRWAVDGGVLDNSPIGVVLDTVTGLSTQRAVQRAVVFVVPYADDRLKPPEHQPGFSDVLGTALNMPRDVAYTDHLEEVETDLARRAGDRTAYDTFLALPPALLQKLAEDVYPAFWRLRAVTSLWTLMKSYGSRLSDKPEAGVALPGLEVANSLAALAADSGVKWLPAFPGNPPTVPEDLWTGITSNDAAWRWGGAPAERIGLRIADWLMAAREATELDAKTLRASLTGCQQRVHTAIRTFRIVDRARQGAEAADVANAPLPLSQADLVKIASDTWTPDAQNAARDLLNAVASELVAARKAEGLTDDARRILGIFDDAADQSKEKGPNEADRVAGTTDAELAVEIAALATKLLMADVAWRGMRGELDGEHQSSTRYEFLRVNATAPLPFQTVNAGHPRRRNGEPGQKLFGLELNHFAGFVRASWRANDFMWGRLDGAARLVDLLLAPRRLRLSPVRYQTLAEIKGLRQPIPAQRPNREYLSPDDPIELEEWRACFQDTLALKIVEEEMGHIVKEMGTDTKNRRFAEQPDLLGALTSGDTEDRFVNYARALKGSAKPPARIKELVEAEHGSDGGKLLIDHAGLVLGKVLEGQGGVEAKVGRFLVLFGLRRLEMDARWAAKIKRLWNTVRHPFGAGA